MELFDIVIIGTGLGASAIAHKLAPTGAAIAMTPGVGCARFKHLDGGLMSYRQLESAFGTSAEAPLHQLGNHSTFRRDHLESWALDLVRDRVTVVNDFQDLRIAPHDDGVVALHEESEQRQLIARLVILTEGASPKIGIAAKIRPDFEPEDLLHFGRAILPGVDITVPVSGTWRTSWSMPAWYSAIPHPDGAIVSASARIENIMRVSKDGREALKVFLESQIARDLQLTDTADVVGMELVPLRVHGGNGKVGTANIVIAPDANGTVDPRSLQRYELGLRAGVELGEIISQAWPQIPQWDPLVERMRKMIPGDRTPYHDSSETGFVEEGAGPARGLLQRILKR